MKTKAIIIDDEQNKIDHLAFLLQTHCPQIDITGTAKNADDGETIILQQNPDIVFLDIQMPAKSGFDLLKSLKKYSFVVIFVTGFEKYAIQAVKFAAIDYLLKPIDPNELKQAVQTAFERLSQKQEHIQLQYLVDLWQQQREQNQKPDQIILRTHKETRIVPVNEIIRCRAENNYTNFVLAGQQEFLVSGTIQHYHEMLANYGFVRCHQSHLVNKKYIKSWIKGKNGYLIMKDNTNVPISRNKREIIKQQLNSFV